MPGGQLRAVPPRGGQFDAVDAVAPGIPRGEHGFASLGVLHAVPGRQRDVGQCVQIGIEGGAAFGGQAAIEQGQQAAITAAGARQAWRRLQKSHQALPCVGHPQV